MTTGTSFGALAGSTHSEANGVDVGARKWGKRSHSDGGEGEGAEAPLLGVPRHTFRQVCRAPPPGQPAGGAGGKVWIQWLFDSNFETAGFCCFIFSPICDIWD